MLGPACIFVKSFKFTRILKLSYRRYYLYTRDTRNVKRLETGEARAEGSVEEHRERGWSGQEDPRRKSKRNSRNRTCGPGRHTINKCWCLLFFRNNLGLLGNFFIKKTFTPRFDTRSLVDHTRVISSVSLYSTGFREYSSQTNYCQYWNKFIVVIKKCSSVYIDRHS